MNNDLNTLLKGCETLMLDMDGTILDLAFDNYVWKELMPVQYAERKGLSLQEAQQQLISMYTAIKGELEWYCLDHWSERLELDVFGLHCDVRHRIQYLPGAKQFLKAVQHMNIRVLLVTNSHPDTLRLKDSETGLGTYMDGQHSSHTYGYAKERQEFWRALQEDTGFDAETTLFVDDTQRVLRSAASFGISSLVTVTRPDSSEAVRSGSSFTAVESIRDLL